MHAPSILARVTLRPDLDVRGRLQIRKSLGKIKGTVLVVLRPTNDARAAAAGHGNHYEFHVVVLGRSVSASTYLEMTKIEGVTDASEMHESEWVGL